MKDDPIKSPRSSRFPPLADGFLIAEEAPDQRETWPSGVQVAKKSLPFNQEF